MANIGEISPGSILNSDWFKKLQYANAGGGGTAVFGASSAPPTPGGQLTLQTGYMPDYASLIANSPLLKAALAQNEEMLKQAAANRTETLRSLAIRYGGLPSGFSDKYGDINSDTLGLAQKNEQSDIARINRQYDDNVFNARHALAARGALESGETQYTMDRANMAKESSVYDAGNAFSDAARSAIYGYLQNEQSAKAAELAAQQAAAQAIFANPAYAPIPASNASLVPDWQTRYGVPVYQGPDGSLYDANGNPFSPQSQPGSQTSPIINWASKQDGFGWVL